MSVEFFKSLSPWFLYLVYPLAVLLLFGIKKFVFRKLNRWSEKTSHRWDDLIARSLNLPLSLLLLSASLVLLPTLFSLPPRWREMISLSARLVAVVAFAVFVQKVLLALYRKYVASQSSLQTYSGLIRVLLSVGVYAIFLLIFLDTAGISITPLIASLGVGGIAVALALQDTLANLFSGFYMVLDQPIRVGDYIELESGHAGYVEAIGWRGVRIRKLPNVMVVIPNSKLAGSIIVNYHLPEKEMAALVEVGVDYSSDLERVEQVTTEVAREVMKTVEGGVPSFEPFIRYHTFDNSSINFTVILRAQEFVNQYLLKHEFIKRLKKRYDAERITIPFPIRTVHWVESPQGTG